MRQKLKLLLVAKTERDAQSVISEFNHHGYQPRDSVVTNESDLQSAIGQSGWDIIIICCALAGFSCLEVIRLIRANDVSTPVFVIADPETQQTAEQSLRAGADDLILRDNLERLIPVVEQILKNVEVRRMREQVEQSLLESEKRYRELVMNMGEGLVLLDVGARFTFANPMAETFFGMASNDLIGHNLEHFLDDEQLVSLQPDIEKLKNGQESSFTFTLNRIAGAERVLRVTFNPRYSGDGEFLGMIGPMMDITEQVNLERQLRQMQTMEAIGALAGGIAHDFNNILFGILGNADLALSEIATSHRVHKRLENIVIAGNRAKNLVKQILAFARKTEKQRMVLEVYPIVREVHKLLRATIPANIEIGYTCDNRGASVIADPTEIHQVIMNLCTNAWQAMMRTGGELMIIQESIIVDHELAGRYEAFEDGQELVILKIQDTGDGISPEILEKIFEPFFTTKAPGEGTGLGLVVAQGIIKSMDGVITVESEVGSGTCFRIYLPQADEQVDEFEAFIRELPHGTEHVLLVDDEEVLTRMVGEMLISLGYEVTTFNSSPDALAAFKSTPDAFDLIITDQAMPKMTGGELSQKVLQVRPDLPIILCTGFSQTLTPELAKKTGIREYLLKPITPEDLSNVVRAVLDKPEELTVQSANG